MSVPNVPICRICLSNDELQVSLFSEYAQRKLLLTKIRVCLPITITHADTLPVTICSQCIVRLEQFYEYYCKSETSQRILTAGNDHLSASNRHKTLPESYQLNSTLTVDGDPSGMRTTACLVSEPGEHGSVAIEDQMDPILTQSPQVKRPAVTQEIQSPRTSSMSPRPTLSFLLHGSKDRTKRKPKKALTQNEFTKF
uniref:ZAD domain-containing protein n=1 Tax=Anopheles minimus TaxID=112268 RepID=A0A182VZF1_9DIPT